TTLAGFNPYNLVVSQLVQLTGLAQSRVIADLQSKNNDDLLSTTAGQDEVQRQINTLIQQAPYATDASGPAYEFGNVLVSGGNVTILAGVLAGDVTNGVKPSITAHGQAKIDFENRGINFLELSRLTISSVAGGNILFTGVANASNVLQSSSQGI